MNEEQKQEITSEDFTRIANNFYHSYGLVSDINRIGIDSNLFNYFTSHQGDIKQKFRVAFCWICLNPSYWVFAKNMIEGAKRFFLPGHNVDYFLWSDIPDDEKEIAEKVTQNITQFYQAKYANQPLTQDQVNLINAEYDKELKNTIAQVQSLKNINNLMIFPTEAIEWPMPTLLRYSLFLQQEEKLKEYDYIFYCDVDMQFVNVVGDEILGEGLTAAQHPMYALRKEYWPPYEPNPESQAHIKRPGKIIEENGKPRFMPLYYAGGFQGGKSAEFIKAMKVMKKSIDKDFNNNYIAIWNDETHWNKYLADNPPSVVLTPSYIYPDSLIREYYEPLWGISYQPKLVTLTKRFSTSSQGGEAVRKMIETMKPL